MHRPQPNRLHDELDALLDGRPVELTDELAPLVEAADALRLELAAHQLDPHVADRHLERVLGGSTLVVPMPTRPRPNGWDLRRRVVAVALAAALVLAPATMASAAALPGQAMYPFKLAIEQLRLASVQWSPAREAGERTRVANERLSEVQDLLELRMYNQLPTAIKALNQAVLAARDAVQQARQEGEPVPEVEAKLGEVWAAGVQVVTKVSAAAEKGTVGLSGNTAEDIQAAVQQSPAVKPPDPVTPTTVGGPGTPTQPTSAPPASQGPGTTTPATQPTPPPTTKPPEPSTSQAPTTTTEPPPTTDEPPTTTPPPSSQPDVTAGSSGVDAGGTAGQAGPGEQATQGYGPPAAPPPTTTPPTTTPPTTTP
jgi:Domain of unknown function (DUF5667)